MGVEVGDFGAWGGEGRELSVGLPSPSWQLVRNWGGGVMQEEEEAPGPSGQSCTVSDVIMPATTYRQHSSIWIKKTLW